MRGSRSGARSRDERLGSRELLVRLGSERSLRRDIQPGSRDARLGHWGRGACHAHPGGRNDRPVCWGISLFIADEGGYTIVALAVALLLSCTLVFGTAAAEWSMARSADVQEVADAAALAGQNCVAGFATVAQVVDACVLTMGLTGIVVCGAGLVVSAIPGLQAEGLPILDAGRSVLDARRAFARSAGTGLRTLEQALPALIMANSASCVAANAQDGMRYVGVAVPFPQQSQSDYSYLDQTIDPSEMEQQAQELSEASARKDEAHQKAEAAKERAWRADNVDSPLCLQSRASSLAGLGGSLNPTYPAPEVWKFEYARLRARNYYARRYAIEHADGGTTDQLQRSAARRQFFGYAWEALGRMSCVEREDEVRLTLEVLPHNADMVRGTRLYTDAVWPTTFEEQGITLHYGLDCPGAVGAPAGTSSLAAVDAGTVLRCPVCLMDAHAMGNVASASTNIDNGFEHYWRIVVEASREYEAARTEEIAAEREMREAAEAARSAFDEALDALSVEVPKLHPAGSWGCVGVVWRASSTSVPTELTASFLSGATLPEGAALSGATLAPDDATADNTVLARAFDGLQTGGDSLPLALVGSVCGLWSRLLSGYGAAYGKVQDTGARFLDGIGGVLGNKVSTWLRDQLSGLVTRTHLEPADLRLRKPVLVNSQTILDKAGLSKVGEFRSTIAELPSSPEAQVRYLAGKVASVLGHDQFTLAELPIPGLEGVHIPLTVDLSEVGEGW